MFLFNVLLALVWVVLTNDFTPSNFLEGFILAYLLLSLLERAIGGGAYFRKVRTIVIFSAAFLWELLVASFRVLIIVISPELKVHPAIVAIPLDVKQDIEIVLLANLITLTPGTLSVDTSADNRELYVHVIYVDDIEAFRRQIKDGFERRIIEVFS